MHWLVVNRASIGSCVIDLLIKVLTFSYYTLQTMVQTSLELKIMIFCQVYGLSSRAG